MPMLSRKALSRISWLARSLLRILVVLDLTVLETDFIGRRIPIPTLRPIPLIPKTVRMNLKRGMNWRTLSLSWRD
jgi:hypothetical protein